MNEEDHENVGEDLAAPAEEEASPTPEPAPDPLADPGALPDSTAEELAAALDSIDGLEALPMDEVSGFTEPPLHEDPALDVDQMLAGAVTPEPYPEAMPPMERGSAPSFQLQLEASSEQRPALKALAQSLSIDLPEGDAPLLSQLTEYQAIAFRQGALELGASARASIHFPLPSVSEEELALGDLAMVQDIPVPVMEGAPSVVLPQHEQDVMVLTEVGGNILIQQTLGLVTAHCSIARRFFREEEAQDKLRRELQRIAGHAGGLPASRLEALLRDLIRDLQKMVLQKGGNALFGLRLESFPETSHLDPELEQLRLVAFGTASIVEKSGQA